MMREQDVASLVALARYEVPAYPADALPPELAAIPPVKPGSTFAGLRICMTCTSREIRI